MGYKQSQSNAEPLTYLQMFLLGLFVSVIPQSTLWGERFIAAWDILSLSFQ